MEDKPEQVVSLLFFNGNINHLKNNIHKLNYETTLIWTTFWTLCIRSTIFVLGNQNCQEQMK